MQITTIGEKMDNIQKFEHDGQEFEVKIECFNEKYNVKVFLQGEQVSPEYSVNIETHQDFFSQHQQSLIDKLVNIAQSDIERGLYYKA